MNTMTQTKVGRTSDTEMRDETITQTIHEELSKELAHPPKNHGKNPKTIADICEAQDEQQELDITTKPSGRDGGSEPVTPATEEMPLSYDPSFDDALMKDGADKAGATAPSACDSPIMESDQPRGNDTTTGNDVTTKTVDIFDDLAALAPAVNSFGNSIKVLTSLPVRKPARDGWVRCHKSIAAEICLYENKDEREHHLVLPNVAEVIEDLVRPVRLTLAVNDAGIPFIWPVPIPSGANPHQAHVSAYAAAEQSEKEWIRISWGKGAYEVHRRLSPGTDPVWPEEITNASDMLRFATKSGSLEVITSIDHPVIKRLLGND